MGILLHSSWKEPPLSYLIKKYQLYLGGPKILCYCNVLVLLFPRIIRNKTTFYSERQGRMPLLCHNSLYLMIMHINARYTQILTPLSLTLGALGATDRM